MSKPCLPVSRRRKGRDNNDDTAAPITFDDIGTMDATEYLSRVVRQSRGLPDIMVQKSPPSRQHPLPKKYAHHVPIQGSAASLSYLASDRTAVLPPPSTKHLPRHCPEWVDQTLANFSQLRFYLDRLHKQQQQQQHGGGSERADRKQCVPPMKDRPGWHIFCVGKKEARGNAGSYFADDDDDEEEEEEEEVDKDGDSDNGDKEEDPTKKLEKGEKLDMDLGNNNRIPEQNDTASVKDERGSNSNTNNNTPVDLLLWQQDLPEEGFYPSTSLILQLDQVMVRHVISHLAHYVQEGWYPCTLQRTLWLYSLLARLEKPVHRNEAAVLYGLLKTLARARVALWGDNSGVVQKDRDGLARLNVLITIIGIYFEQGGGYGGVMEASK